ncbi:MAG: DUF5301 domain-containing protein [Cellulosilyticaceae bacterium]
MIIGTITLYNDFFPRPEPVNLPYIAKITAIEITKNDFHVSYHDATTLKGIMTICSKAKPTRALAVQDAPTVSDYYTVKITTRNDNEATILFIYKKNAKWYVEQPYQGFYEIDKSIGSYVEERTQ